MTTAASSTPTALARCLRSGLLAVAARVSVLATQISCRESGPAGGAPTDAEHPRVLRVASRFLCPCGGCEDMGLEECTCAMSRGARETKAVIADLLAGGLTEDRVSARVARDYRMPESLRSADGPREEAPPPVACH